MRRRLSTALMIVLLIVCTSTGCHQQPSKEKIPYCEALFPLLLHTKEELLDTMDWTDKVIPVHDDILYQVKDKTDTYCGIPFIITLGFFDMPSSTDLPPMFSDADLPFDDSDTLYVKSFEYQAVLSEDLYTTSPDQALIAMENIVQALSLEYGDPMQPYMYHSFVGETDPISELNCNGKLYNIWDLTPLDAPHGVYYHLSATLATSESNADPIYSVYVTYYFSLNKDL